MILPPQRLSGLSGAPITVRALNDGKVLIDGKYAEMAVQLYYNDWFVIEGINACHSKQSNFNISHSNHNVLRRIVSWDAQDNNSEIFGIHYGSFNTFEDIAGFGTARKIVSGSYGGDHTTIRRAWARWERSTVVGPKMTYTLAYDNYYMTCENCIGSWSGQSMPQTYVLRDYSGNPWTGSTGGTYTNYAVEQPQGIFSADGDDAPANANLLGSLAYVLSTDNFKPAYAVYLSRLDNLQVRDTMAVIASGKSVTPFGFINKPGAKSLHAADITSKGGLPSLLQSEWQFSNMFMNGSYSTGENAFNTSRGANLCYRYQDGVQTTQPLWPWPMNQRIKDGLSQSGRAQVDVTATVQSLLGTIPSQCMGSGSVGSPSPTPTPNPNPTPTPTPPATSGSGVTADAIYSSSQWQFTVPTSGTYRMWGHIVGPDASSDSFYYNVDGAADEIYDIANGTWSNSYQWSVFNSRQASPQTARTFSLGAGTHTIYIKAREPNSKIDRIVVTASSSYDPNDGGSSSGVYESAMTNAQWQVTLPAGTYRLWGHVTAADDGSDSVYYNVDGNADEVFDTGWQDGGNVYGSGYTWSIFNSRVPGVGTPRLFTFSSSGTHTINVRVRETGTLIDRIQATSNMSYVP